MGTITTTDGTEIFLKDWGSGQPIVFSHGWPLSADDWDTQMLFFLSHDYRVIAADRRGHGRSTQTGDGHDMDHWRYRIRATTGASDAKRAAVARTQRGARYGSGTLVRRAGPNGDTWIAKWRDGGRQVQRGRGFVHAKRHVDGLTRAEAEAALGSAAVVPRVMADGWARLPVVSPALADLVVPLFDDLAPLVAALGKVPHTLVHGDWKAANIGSHTDGRTVLLDFGEASGEASPIADLSWYLALNSDLLPETKDDAISTYRAALEGHGIDTGGWWARAVALEMLGTMVQFGWEKAFGGPGPELAWWEAWATAGATCL